MQSRLSDRVVNSSRTTESAEIHLSTAGRCEQEGLERPLLFAWQCSGRGPSPSLTVPSSGLSVGVY